MKRLIALLFLLPICARADSVQSALSSITQTSHYFGSGCPYPESARSAHNEGITTLSFQGLPDGHIANVTVVNSSGYADLDYAAVQCVNHWYFNPNDAADKFNIGVHPVAIAWRIPNVPPGAPSNPPVGLRVGMRHTCESFYPKVEAEAGIEGTTQLSFTITVGGGVRDVTVVQSSRNSNLDSAAIQCAYTWRYRPAIQFGEPVESPWKAMVVWKSNIVAAPPFAEPPRDCLHSYPVKVEDIAGIHGATDLTFKIVRGEVRDVTVTRSSGNPALDRAAVECVGTRRYKRQMVTAQNGEVVDLWQSTTLSERINWSDALKSGK